MVTHQKTAGADEGVERQEGRTGAAGAAANRNKPPKSNPGRGTALFLIQLLSPVRHERGGAITNQATKLS